MKYFLALTLAVTTVACSSGKTNKTTPTPATKDVPTPEKKSDEGDKAAPQPDAKNGTPATDARTARGEKIDQKAKDPKPKDNNDDEDPAMPMHIPGTKRPRAGQPATSPQQQTGASPAADEKKLDWKLPDIKIRLLDSLQAVGKKENTGAIVDNKLEPQQSALNRVIDRGQGMICQTASISQDLAAGDILSFTQATSKTDKTDVHSTIATIQYVSSQDQKQIVFECIIRGEQTANDFVTNLNDFVIFKDAQGQFTFDESQYSQEYYKTIDKKTRSFKITNLEKLSKTDVNAMGEKNVMNIINGDLVPAGEAQQRVTLGKAKQTCEVGLTKGGMKAGIVYKLVDTDNRGEDTMRGLAQSVRIFKSDTNEEIYLACLMMRGSKPEDFMDNFKGILEFGAADAAPAK